MKLLVLNETGRVLGRFTDDARLSITESEVRAPGVRWARLTAADVTVYAGTDTPTADRGRWAYDGQSFRDLWPWRVLRPLEFVAFVQATAGVDDAALSAALNDARLAVLWWKLGRATEIERDSDLTTGGLAAFVAAEHLTQAQADAVLAAWPKGRRP